MPEPTQAVRERAEVMLRAHWVSMTLDPDKMATLDTVDESARKTWLRRAAESLEERGAPSEIPIPESAVEAVAETMYTRKRPPQEPWKQLDPSLQRMWHVEARAAIQEFLDAMGATVEVEPAYGRNRRYNLKHRIVTRWFPVEADRVE